MTRMKLILAALALAAVSLGVQSASAQDTVHFLAAGSSAMWQGMALAAANDLAPTTPTVTGGGSIHHWTYKSACPGSTCITVLHDPRTNPDTGAIPNEPSNLWIVWTCPAAGCNGTTQKAVDIWAYHQVDSTVGVRSFMSRPNGCGSPCNTSAVESLVTNDVEGPNTAYAGVNAVSPSLYATGSGVGSWGAGDTSCGTATTCDDEFVPADVWAAISGANGVAINTGMTDIRPEDAKAATKRANGPATNNVSLGYGTVGSQLIGTPIESSYTATNANPIEFGLPGLPDPFHSVTVPSTITVIPVGEEPIIFIVNRSNPNGLGAADTATGGPYAFTDVEDGQGPIAGTAGNPNPLSALFSGYDCAGENAAFYDDAASPNASLAAAGVANFPTTNIQREALSGTMNTTEWSVFRTKAALAGLQINTLYPHIAGAANGPSQEYNITASTQNPLNTGCEAVNGVTGHRRRAVGTGELVKTGVKATPDSIGYTFFSFGNVSTIGKAASYGYLTLDEVDPIFASYTGAEPGQPGNGELPTCTPPNCNTSSIWNNPAGSFPNLRNGTYRAWSLLRAICDTAVNTCETDTYGTKALITNLQNDIGNAGSPTAVADFLPFQQATYVRAHYNIVPGVEHADPFAYYFDQPPVGTAGTLTLDVAASAPGAEQGGDAGGCILPLNNGVVAGYANDTTVWLTAVTANGGGTTTYSYTNDAGTPLKTLFGYGHPTTLSVWGFPAAGNNGTFTIHAVGGASVTVNNGAGTVQTNPGVGAPNAPNGTAGNGSPAGSTNTACYQ